MECKNCKYLRELKSGFANNMCDITHRFNPISCSIESDEIIERLPICYNCQHWYGGGDWGLSCVKNYYNCSINGFDEACERFERKVVVYIEYDN